MSTLLAIIRIGNHKLLFLFIRQRNYANTFLCCIRPNGTDVNKMRHGRLIYRLIFL